jgi:hypothetical protein
VYFGTTIRMNKRKKIYENLHLHHMLRAAAWACGMGCYYTRRINDGTCKGRGWVGKRLSIPFIIAKCSTVIVREKKEFMYLSGRLCISLILSILSGLDMWCGVNIMSAVSLWNIFELNLSSTLSLACSLRVSNGFQPSPSISWVTLCVRS